MMKLIWHPLALNDLELIVTYCRNKFGYTTGTKVLSRLQQDAALLKSHPQLGHPEEELNDVSSPLPVYRSLHSGPTKIVYTVHDDYVYIHMLWNTCRNPLAFHIEMRKRKEE